MGIGRTRAFPQHGRRYELVPRVFDRRQPLCQPEHDERRMRRVLFDCKREQLWIAVDVCFISDMVLRATLHRSGFQVAIKYKKGLLLQYIQRASLFA